MKKPRQFRIDQDLLERFDRVNDELAANGSEVVRRLIEEYTIKKEEELFMDLIGKSFTVNSQWVRENDPDMFHGLWEIFQEFVSDEDNEASEEDLEAYKRGEFLVHYLFKDGEVHVTVGKDPQDMANQNTWAEDDLSEMPPETIELYKKQISREG